MMTTAIVSPSARPRPSIEAEITPGRPNGRTAVRTISHWVAPSASAASLCRIGVCAKTSRLMAVTIGRIMIASTTPMENTVPGDVRPGENSGNQPKVLDSQLPNGWMAGARTWMPHRPKMIEGTAASRSTR